MHSQDSSKTKTQHRVVAESDRHNFLSRLFGTSRAPIGEFVVYNFMREMCEHYNGGFWDFIEVGDALYMAPQSPEHYTLKWGMNGYEGVVTKGAAGIIVTLFALSHLSFIHPDPDGLAEAYHRLLDSIRDHPEAPEIFRAID